MSFRCEKPAIHGTFWTSSEIVTEGHLTIDENGSPEGPMAEYTGYSVNSFLRQWRQLLSRFGTRPTADAIKFCQW